MEILILAIIIIAIPAAFALGWWARGSRNSIACDPVHEDMEIAERLRREGGL